jgi:uncharacterized protein (TIGR02687 family)
MAELNLKQIADKLEEAFSEGDGRKLVFWYDEQGDFREEIGQLQLKNAKIYRLEEHNQVRTKVFLEREDTETNYLIYAPFPKPDVADNHLEDTLLYSRRFYADRASLLMADLGISEDLKPVVERHVKFFAAKARSKRFTDLGITEYTERSFTEGIISALCGLRVCSFEEALRVILSSDDGGEKYLEEMEKYNLLPVFWSFCADAFGCREEQKNQLTLKRLVISLLVTDAVKCVCAGAGPGAAQQIQSPWKPFLLEKPGSVVTFLDSVRNNILYRDAYDRYADQYAEELNVRQVFAVVGAENLLNCDTFADADTVIVKWILERLLDENTEEMLQGFTIPEICDMRARRHFSSRTASAYRLLHCAWTLMRGVQQFCPAEGFAALLAQYQEKGWKIDQAYRKFYLAFDELEQKESMEPLRVKIERIYNHEYLDVLLPAWSRELPAAYRPDADPGIVLQRRFYTQHLASETVRTAVIISDAMRYEVGRELLQKLNDNPNATVSISGMLSTVPSYTQLGMAALLPHKTLEMTEDYKVLADGLPTQGTAAREKILKNYNPSAVCVPFDEIKNMNRDELRGVVTGKSLLYIFHNQIDARGDKPATEDEVFRACEEAVDEIAALISNLTNAGNTVHYIVTADHGFLYRRDAVQEVDKIDVSANDFQGGSGLVTPEVRDAWVNRRFIVSGRPMKAPGVMTLPLDPILGKSGVSSCAADDRAAAETGGLGELGEFGGVSGLCGSAGSDGQNMAEGSSLTVSVPTGNTVFKVQGGGANYVHGGPSPQETLIPVIECKTDAYRAETRRAGIVLVSTVRKITNLICPLEFIQTDAVSDTVVPARYRILFIDDTGNPISNEQFYDADSREEDSSRRIFRRQFQFKNQKYSREKKYYLVIVDETGIETARHEVIMDIAMADDFGF